MESERLKGYLTVSQASRLLKVTPDRVRQMEGEGKLSALFTPLGRLFRQEEIKRLQEERRKKTAA